MPTDSIVDPKLEKSFVIRRPAAGCSAIVLLSLFLTISLGCIAAPTVVIDDLLEPLALPTRWIPSDADLAAASLARASLFSGTGIASNSDGVPREGTGQPRQSTDASKPADRAVEDALAALTRTNPNEDNLRLVPLAIDLRNATLDDPILDREQSRKLRDRRGLFGGSGLDPRLRSRLDRLIDNDPIRLAKKRQFDGWHRLWARTFNAVSQPLGSSVITGFVLAPYQLTNSIIHYLADFSNNEALSLTDRQALVLRQEFLLRHPETKLTSSLEAKIEKSQIRLEETLALRRVRAAETALDHGEPELALHHAKAARQILLPHPNENLRLRRRIEKRRSKAIAEMAVMTRRRLESLEAEPTPNVSKKFRMAAAALARSLLKEKSNPAELDFRLVDYQKECRNDGDDCDDAGRDGLVEFILALRQHEQSDDEGARRRLGIVATIGLSQSKMARHATTLLDDTWQNPYGAFERLERAANREELAWRLAGEWVRRTRYPNLPTPLAYLIDTPTIAITIVLAPLRALTSPWTGSPDFRRAPALAGYRYLRRFPRGAKQREVIDWLYDYEYDEKRWGRALRLADLIPDFDAKDRAELIEKMADRRLAGVDSEDRRDKRSSILKGLAREFPDSEGGKEAGLRMREEIEDASAQHIRITKGFLLENANVAGANGLGLNPRLLNDDHTDGELHPDGVLLRGGRTLEILLIAEGGDEDDPPESRSRKISKQRLSQIASSLDEAIQLNGLIDVGARQSADASRDVYLERAALGLTEEIDPRPTAESTHVYQSLRERYGLVRGRDSILPFDLVLRGSLDDLTLGAFPRWRPPRETPDAFLYR
jgi:hypothetical protein